MLVFYANGRERETLANIVRSTILGDSNKPLGSCTQIFYKPTYRVIRTGFGFYPESPDYLVSEEGEEILTGGTAPTKGSGAAATSEALGSEI